MLKMLAAVLTGVILLTGCNPSADSEPTEVTVTATPTQEMTDEEAYLYVIRDEYPVLNEIPDNELVTLGETTCEALDSGVTLDEMFEVVLSSGMEPGMGGFIIGVAIGAFCPHHENLIDSGTLT